MAQKFSFLEKTRINWALRKRVREFKKTGYSEITLAELQPFLDYRWQRKKLTSLSDRLADIQAFSVNDYFDYQQIKIQTTQKSLDELEDFSDLF